MPQLDLAKLKLKTESSKDIMSLVLGGWGLTTTNLLSWKSENDLSAIWMLRVWTYITRRCSAKYVSVLKGTKHEDGVSLKYIYNWPSKKQWHIYDRMPKNTKHDLYAMTNYDMLKLNTKHGQCKWSLTDLWELLITDNKTTRAECGVRCIRPMLAWSLICCPWKGLTTYLASSSGTIWVR